MTDNGDAVPGAWIAEVPTTFRYPKAVAIGPDGAVYAGCCRPGGLERFTLQDGQWIADWTVEGGKVCGIAVQPDGTVCATMHDQHAPCVRRFAPHGRELGRWGREGAGRLTNPQGVSSDSDGRFYVVEANLWGGDGLADLNRVVRFGPNGDLQNTWGGTGTEPGRLNLPVGIAVGPDDRIHVCDSYNCRIQTFAPDGTFLSACGSFGRGPGEFDCPQGIALDAAGRLYVADTYNNRIQVLSPDGAPLALWGGDGTEAGRLWVPCGLAVDDEGRMYVADTMNHRIQVFQPDLEEFSKAPADAGSPGSRPAVPAPPGLSMQPDPVVQEHAGALATGPSESVESRMHRMALERGASHFGIADLTRAWETWPESFGECGQLLTGIAIGVREEDELLDRLPVTDDPGRTAHYVDKIALALEIGDQIAEELVDRGHKACRLSHPPTGRPTGLYKLTARLAGLGWIGKNRLLITPDAGPRVALAAVLTDAPLEPTASEPLPDGCGDCTRCLDACPVHAYSYEAFAETDSMEGFDTRLCAVNRGIINPGGWGLCGLCVKVCPLGRQDAES